MAAVPVTIVGFITDPSDPSAGAAAKPVIIVGQLSLTGLTIGGGPIIPPEQPPGIWGPTDPRPTPPIQLPPWAGGWQPGIWGPTDPRPTPPIYIPPPGSQPPPNVEPPEAGEPPVAIGGEQPVHPIAVPPYILVNYPGYGWIAVAPPKPAEQPPSGAPTSAQSHRKA